MMDATKRSRVNTTICRLTVALGTVALLCSALAGCQNESEPGPKEIEVPAAPGGPSSDAAGAGAVTQEGGEILVDGVRFTLPEGWKRVELDPQTMQFISARIALPSDQASLTLSTVGGGIDANIERWFGQFSGSEPSVEAMTVDGHAAKWVDIRGRFQSGPGMGPGQRDDWMMLGVAIANSPSDFYIKLTGPRAEVVQYIEPLREFVNSAQFE